MAQRTKVEPNTTNNTNKNKKINEIVRKDILLYSYTHKSESTQGLIRETSSDRFWEQMQRHTTKYFEELVEP